jgi:hypothetical protein
VKEPDMPPQMSATLDSYQGRGSERRTIDFDRLIPVTRASEVDTKTRIKGDRGGQSFVVGNDAKIKVNIREN